MQKVPQRAVFKRQRAVHVRFAEVQIRAEEQLGAQSRLVQPEGHHRPGGAAEGMPLPPMVEDMQGPCLDEPLKHVREWKHVRPPGSQGVMRARTVSGMPFYVKMRSGSVRLALPDARMGVPFPSFSTVHAHRCALGVPPEPASRRVARRSAQRRGAG